MRCAAKTLAAMATHPASLTKAERLFREPWRVEVVCMMSVLQKVVD
jgi:hypothetical protein